MIDLDKSKSFQLRQLNERDLPAVVRVQQAVTKALPDPTLFRDGDADFLRGLLSSGAASFGIFSRTELVAYSAVRFPEDGALTLGTTLGIDQSKARLVAEFDGVAVLPDYRGNGFQVYLTEARAKVSLLHGRPICAASVAPHNFHSLRNFLDYGMTARALTQLYGGVDRLIVARDHGATANPTWLDLARINANDLPSLIQAFRHGYEVLSVRDNGKTFVIGRRAGCLDDASNSGRAIRGTCDLPYDLPAEAASTQCQ